MRAFYLLAQLTLEAIDESSISALHQVELAEMAELANRHRVRGLLAKAYLDYTPECADKRAWAHDTIGVIQKAQGVYAAECALLQTALHNNGISSLAVKGNDFAKRLYELPQCRDCSKDIDIMVDTSQIYAAIDTLKQLGYFIDLAKLPPSYITDPEAKLAYRIAYHHDAVVLYKGDKDSKVELHHNANFESLNIKRVFRECPEAYGCKSLSDIDAFLLCSWHLYHHGRNIRYSMSPPLRIRLRQIADWWRAYQLFVRPQSVSTLTARIAETMSADAVIYAVRKVVNLLATVGTEAPHELIKLEKEVAALGYDHGIDRITDDEWIYGDYKTSYWQYVYHREQEEAAIEKSIAAALPAIAESRLTYQAVRYDSLSTSLTSSSVVRMVEPNHVKGTDRIGSYVLLGQSPTDGLPQISWRMCWSERQLQIQIGMQNRKILAAETAVTPVPVDTISIVICPTEGNEGIHEYLVTLVKDGVKLFRLRPCYQVLDDAGWSAQYIDDGQVDIQGIIKLADLPVNLALGNTFGLSLRYFERTATGATRSILAWPSGAIKRGKVTFV